MLYVNACPRISKIDDFIGSLPNYNPVASKNIDCQSNPTTTTKYHTLDIILI